MQMLTPAKLATTQTAAVAQAAAVPTLTSAKRQVNSANTQQVQCPQVQQSTHSGSDTLGPWLGLLGVIAVLGVKWWLDTKKRRFDVKRKLYLKVADALNDGGHLFGSMGDPSLSITDLGQRFKKILAALSNAEMVAGNSLLKALADLKNFAGNKFADFIEIRLRAEVHWSNANFLQPEINQVEADIVWIEAEVRRLQIALENSPDHLRALKLRAELFGKRADLLRQKAVSVLEALPVVADLARMAAEFAHEIIAIRVEVLARMRSELDFPFDIIAYRRSQEDMARQAAGALDRITEAARRTFAGDGD